ncbi:Fe2+-dependent dioxygenase [Alterisphingorhabdus coralli]|uniref:Fe2+-dependent dioxygenase n=1 Tax=Alterisphingorhabdus coralli TaxID=3071408 RepID=A0AA97FCJ3_9SPHN|nr:Fe2+-dependent dioxygenase [Parasphingorhabdus sp. SCSIO 66989]WOE76555.1 Fe2+-dependent dioxygenase [Parasphingorhabdus sp. SCSIO 66989]
MIKQIPDLLSGREVKTLKALAAKANFVDGRISNPHSKVKNNLHLHDEKAWEKSSSMLETALMRHEDFRNFAFPSGITKPLITKYDAGMRYGLHPDSPMMMVEGKAFRSDLSCTIFLNDPDSYEGGALRILLGDSQMRFKGAAGSAVVYPSTTLHEVEEVTEGERLVGLCFIQSRIPDTAKRNLLYELNEVAALEGLGMSDENYTRIQAVQFNLSRMWMDN